MTTLAIRSLRHLAETSHAWTLGRKLRNAETKRHLRRELGL